MQMDLPDPLGRKRGERMNTRMETTKQEKSIKGFVLLLNVYRNAIQLIH